MAATQLVYAAGMADYRFGPSHPMLPERFTLAVELARAWGLLAERPDDIGRAVIVEPEPADEADLLRVHSRDYINAVRDELRATPDDAWGLGEGDTPRFERMHEVSALIVGGTIRALDDVLSGACTRAFNPAGGLHHAHRDRAAGFCVYNDCAVAIASATAAAPGLRVAYVDIDAHHGDGVEECFRTRSDVLTISLHESGRYLYPGTGASRDIGEGAGRGYAVNVPLPPHAGAAEFELAFERVVEPALAAFRPDVIVAQLGADTHASDPLTQLGMTVAGYAALAERLAGVADRLCAGRIAATGGGGYDAFSATPRMWACALAALLGVKPPPGLPEAWLDLARRAAAARGTAAPRVSATFDETAPVARPALPADEVRRLAEIAIAQTVAASPLLGGGAA